MTRESGRGDKAHVSTARLHESCTDAFDAAPSACPGRLAHGWPLGPGPWGSVELSYTESDPIDVHRVSRRCTHPDACKGGRKQTRDSAGSNASNAADAQHAQHVQHAEITHGGGAGRPMRVVSRVFSVLLTLLRMAYVAVTMAAYCATGKTQWTVDFCLTALALASVGNGMSTRETTLILLVGHVMLFPCVLSHEHSSGSQRYIDMVNQALLSILAYYSTRIETAGHLSTWIGVRCPVFALRLCRCVRAPARLPWRFRFVGCVHGWRRMASTAPCMA